MRAWLNFVRRLAAVLAVCLIAARPAAAANAQLDVRHIIPPFDPALDAAHAPAGFGTGRIWRVGPNETYKQPSAVARLVRDGDIVEIDAAVYKCDQSVRWTANNLTLVGVGGRPVLDATGCKITGGKGIWNPSGKNLIVDNIAFVGARVASQNGAGIRYDGTGYLYITHAYFHDNEDGILYTPNQRFLATNNLVIDRSEFDHNGYPTGQAHNMYINPCNSFVLRFSYSHDAIIGHEVKSRAWSNYILYNRIADEANGTASYDIDLPQGGISYIIGNVIQKAPNADNSSNISYAVENARPNPVQRLYIAYNTIINQSSHVQARHVLFIQDRNLVQARMVDNLIVGVPASALMTGDAADKVQLAGNVVTDRPSVYDAAHRLYFLTAGSPAVHRAVPAGDGSGFPLQPKIRVRLSGWRQAAAGRRQPGCRRLCVRPGPTHPTAAGDRSARPQPDRLRCTCPADLDGAQRPQLRCIRGLVWRQAARRRVHQQAAAAADHILAPLQRADRTQPGVGHGRTRRLTAGGGTRGVSMAAHSRLRVAVAVPVAKGQSRSLRSY